jgi:dolichol-phosphate mannosyltransferase
MVVASKVMDKSGWQVPAFDVHELRERQHKYCVCIPVINEGARLTAQLGRMKELNLDADIIVGDGGSTDGSNSPELLRGCGVRTLLIKTGPGRLSAQMRMLFAYAIEQGYSGMVFIDGNGKDGVEAIPLFLKALDQNYDFVQGSRFLPGGEERNTPWDRRLGAKLIHAPLISLAARFRYTDTTNGFRAYSARFLADSKVQPFRDVFDTYNLHYYLSIRAPRLGFRVKEVPVTRIYPASGPVPSKISGVAGKLAILKLLFLAAAGHYNPKIARPGK